MENNQIPEIRFVGFTGDWKQEKLGDIVEFYSGLTYSPENVQENGTLVLRSSNVKNDAIVSADDVFVDSEIAKSEQVKPGDIIVVVRNGSRSLIGKHALIKRDMPNTVIGAFMTGLRSDEPDFTNALLGTEQFAKEIQKNLGATINQITTGEFKKMNFKAPTNKAEQRKIGAFISSFDNLITLHQQELNTLKETMQGFLQKMFPKEGESVPEVRFPGFTREWEQQKLGESVNFLNGRAYKQNELLDSGKYRVLRVGNFNTNDRWYYSDLELEENKYANTGDLLYLWSTNFGPEIWNEEKIIYHYHIWKLEITNNRLDKQYLYTWLENDKERIKQHTNGTTMVHVTKGNMEERKFQVPVNIEEQQKIGSFFKQLHDTIALQQFELDALKETKKAFLQKMFI